MKTFQHTLPDGTDVVFSLKERDGFLLVQYPAGTDISMFSSDEAYPIQEIEKVFGKTGPAIHYGQENDTVWEMWALGA
jgi:hypothetical protein